MKKEEKEAEKTYNFIAEFYHNYRTKMNPRGWFYNEHLEMPMTLKLLGNIGGKKILDMGCGTGIYAKLLTKKGAKLKGFDISDEMLKIARKDNPKLDLRKGSLYKIPFKEKFDIVYAALAMDYVPNWDKVFRNVSNVLKKNGIFIFSTGNPLAEMLKSVKVGEEKLKVFGIRNYFEEDKVHYSKWDLKNKKVRVPSYHKTYGTIVKTIVRNGFEIIDYEDTFPSKKSKKLFPEEYKQYSKYPYFCAFKLRKK